MSKASDDAIMLRAALQLVWSIHVRKHTHLGLERGSGVKAHCIPCICACALGRGMDPLGWTAADFDAETEKLKAGDHAANGER